MRFGDLGIRDGSSLRQLCAHRKAVSSPAHMRVLVEEERGRELRSSHINSSYTLQCLLKRS
jgi:hypothetical protein